jgi:hypothetical protein
MLVAIMSPISIIGEPPIIMNPELIRANSRNSRKVLLPSAPFGLPPNAATPYNLLVPGS